MQHRTMYYVVTRALAEAMRTGSAKRVKGKVYGLFQTRLSAESYIEANKLRLTAQVIEQ